MEDAADTDLDFAMLDLGAASPEEAARRRQLRKEKSDAAANLFFAAQANGQDFETAKVSARQAAARVGSLDDAVRHISAATAGLSHLGQHHPALVLLERASELLGREKLQLVMPWGRK